MVECPGRYWNLREAQGIGYDVTARLQATGHVIGSRRGESQSRVTVTGHMRATGYRKACTSQYKSQLGFTDRARKLRASPKETGPSPHPALASLPAATSKPTTPTSLQPTGVHPTSPPRPQLSPSQPPLLQPLQPQPLLPPQLRPHGHRLHDLCKMPLHTRPFRTRTTPTAYARGTTATLFLAMQATLSLVTWLPHSPPPLPAPNSRFPGLRGTMTMRWASAQWIKPLQVPVMQALAAASTTSPPPPVTTSPRCNATNTEYNLMMPQTPSQHDLNMARKSHQPAATPRVRHGNPTTSRRNLDNIRRPSPRPRQDGAGQGLAAAGVSSGGGQL
ncbi:hypothetical protein EDB85DRAFT_1903746 [Lactarius pseudohatsudake]|nr:hypothetical protein EDB85DRAFT_1903746 [Lactarius pseudohatsudake]